LVELLLLAGNGGKSYRAALCEPIAFIGFPEKLKGPGRFRVPAF
jgi:hypothetical protein